MKQPELTEHGGKRCARCGKIKDTFQFRNAGPGRLSDWCVPCINETKPPKPKRWVPPWVNRVD